MKHAEPADRAARLAERRARLPAEQRSLLEQRLSPRSPGAETLPAAPASLVAIQPAGRRPPFFCVHPAGGDVLCFQALSRHLGADQPFYGLQSRGLAADEEPFASIEEMAAAYRAEIVRAASGPYHVGGWSLGGAVAFELARQLAAAGGEVALLAIVDATPGAWPPPAAGGGEAEDGGADRADRADLDEGDDARWLMDIADYLQRLWGVDLGLSHDALAALPPETQALRFLAALQDTPFGGLGAGREQLRRLLQVFKTNVRAFRRYRPGPYPGPITLFRTAAAAGEPRDAAAADDPLRGWGALSPRPIEIESVPGDHISALAEPHVRTLAERLRACIDQAADRRSSEIIGGHRRPSEP
jgi:thioesterase domain-containing protein